MVADTVHASGWIHLLPGLVGPVVSHSFEEQTTTGLEIKWILHPAVVMTLQGKTLSPSSVQEDNTVMLFIKKTITMKPNTLIVL